MKYEYHTIFLSAPRIEPGKFMKQYVYTVDGVQFARDLQASIEKMSESGWELFQTTPIISSAQMQLSYTEGMTVIFRKAL